MEVEQQTPNQRRKLLFTSKDHQTQQQASRKLSSFTHYQNSIQQNQKRNDCSCLEGLKMPYHSILNSITLNSLIEF